jgi:hypothetical protein
VSGTAQGLPGSPLEAFALVGHAWDLSRNAVLAFYER